MKARLFVVLIALLVVGGRAARAQVDQNAVRRALEAQYARLAQAYKQKDSKALMALLAPDVVVQLPEGKSMNRQEAEEDLKRQLATVHSVTSVVYRIENLRTQGREAVVTATGKTRVQIADEGGKLHQLDQTNQVRHTWVRSPQGWRIRRLETLGLQAKVDGKPINNGGIPPNTELKRMVLASLLAWNRAVQSADFAPFHATLSRPFQEQFSPEKLRDVFKEFAQKKIDFSAIRDKEPILTPKPSVSEEGVLSISGYYPTAPHAVRFKLEYLQESGVWRLIGIDVNTK